MSKSAKGGQFERDTCRQLSLWWSGGKHDDIFWRATTSGARATVRGRKGLRTAGNYGDIAATHPSGNLLIDLVTPELKRGYKSASIHDMLDRRKQKPQGFELQLIQAIEAHQNAGSFAWLLITRRNHCNAWVWMPRYLMTNLREFGAMQKMPCPSLQLVVVGRYKGYAGRPVKIVGLPLDDFLAGTTPNHFKQLAAIA